MGSHGECANLKKYLESWPCTRVMRNDIVTVVQPVLPVPACRQCPYGHKFVVRRAKADLEWVRSWGKIDILIPYLARHPPEYTLADSDGPAGWRARIKKTARERENQISPVEVFSGYKTRVPYRSLLASCCGDGTGSRRQAGRLYRCSAHAS